jgi:hypothetical protein
VKKRLFLAKISGRIKTGEEAKRAAKEGKIDLVQGARSVEIN